MCTRTPSVKDDPLRLDPELLASLPERMRKAQILFHATGSLHAAALLRAEGELVCVREDVGRHNAVDKVVGWAAAHDHLPLREHILLVSGRAGFEIVQKALMAQIPVLAAISGPSSLSVSLAREGGMTLIAFLRGKDMNIYSAPERIVRG